MPSYRFVALDGQGQERQGAVSADDARAAASLLRARQLFVVRLESQEDASSATPASPAAPASFAWLPIGAQARVMFFRQLALMLRSGQTLLAALETVHDTCGHARLAQIAKALRSDIERGASFSTALAGHPTVFEPLVVNLIRSAEASGELDTVLGRIGDDMERTLELKRNFLTGLTYPGIVFITAIGISGFLVTKVVPAFATFFAKSGKPIPPGLRNLIAISDWFLTYGHWLGLLIFAALTALALAVRKPAGQLAVDRVLLRVPVVGKLIESAALTRLSWSIAMLLQSGVTVIDALRVGQAVVGNAALGQAVSVAADRVLIGRDLSASLRQPPLPYFIARMAGVGEQTGALVEVFTEVGDFYQKQLLMQIKRLTAMIEPMLILLIGGMVGYVYYAFFEAMFATTG